MKLEKSFNTKNNQSIYFINGREAYPIYKKLGKSGLGFNWYKGKNIWWIYENRLTPEKIAGLKELGVDISLVTEKVEPPISNAQEKTISTPKETISELTNKTDSDSGKAFKDVGGSGYDTIPGRYGFNIKTNIYSPDIIINFEGQEIPLHIVFDRWYQKGRRKIPRYVYNIFFQNQLINRVGKNAPGEWGTYNEDEIASNIQQDIQKAIDQKSKIYKTLEYHLEVDKRDHEFKEFLEKWEELPSYDRENEKEFLSSYLPPKSIEIKEPGYEGNYSIVIHNMGSIYFETDIEHPLAPRQKTLIRKNVPPTIRNLEQFNQYLDNVINENYDTISAKYMEYLKSFPYRAEEEEASRAGMEDMVNMIGKNYDVDFFKNKFAEMGYIRPSKKVKKEERMNGFVPQEKIKWVIGEDNRKNIVNDAYSYTQDPNEFYSTIAYFLLRRVKNDFTMTDMMLGIAINHWYNLAKQYGHEIDYKDIYSYFSKVSSDIYRGLFYKEPPRDRAEEYNDFYNNFGGGEQRGGVSTVSRGLETFISFAVTLGASLEEAVQNPKGTYRKLMMEWHPDRNPNNNKAHDISVQLSTLWDKVPNEIKNAFNWYKKMIYKKGDKNV